MNSWIWKKTVLALSAAFIFLVGTAATTNAQLLYDNGPAGPASSTSYLAQTGGLVINMAGNIFTPFTSGTATNISLTGYYSGTTPTSVSFTIDLYATSANAPTTLITESTLSNIVQTTASYTFGTFPVNIVYDFSGILDTPFVLDSSLTYYLGISGGAIPASSFNVFATETPGPSTIEYTRTSDGNFFLDDGSIAFSLSGTPAAVPEPSSYALALITFALLAFEIRRRAQTS